MEIGAAASPNYNNLEVFSIGIALATENGHDSLYKLAPTSGLGVGGRDRGRALWDESITILALSRSQIH